MEEAFSLSVKPAMNLILAINALIEVDFNSPRIARIDVGVRGFEITVYDNRVDEGIPTEIFKSVSFDAAAMTEFNCQIPLSQMIELDEIIRLLDPVDYHGSVRIFSADGTMLSVASLDSHGVAGLESANFINIALTPKLPTVSAYELEHLKSFFTRLTRFGSGSHPYFAEVWLKNEIVLWVTSTQDNVSNTAPNEFTSLQASKEIWFLFTACTTMRRHLNRNCSRSYIVRDPDDYIMLRNSLDGFGEFIFLQKLNESFFINPPPPSSLENFSPRT